MISKVVCAIAAIALPGVALAQISSHSVTDIYLEFSSMLSSGQFMSDSITHSTVMRIRDSLGSDAFPFDESQVSVVASEVSIVLSDWMLDNYSIEIDADRSAEFLRDQSATFPVMLNLIQASKENSPENEFCELVFPGEGGVISRVSSIELRDVNLQDLPGEHLQAIDKAQCSMCQVARDLNIGNDAWQGFIQRRLQLLDVLLDAELIKSIDQ